ncbi:MAG: hypothetical protein JO129_00370 [Candidatus Dependentiae bacterium]|nr:hypothetical protein [Candidatus Dependentiae bacterium]
MKFLNSIIFSIFLLFGSYNLFAELNEFGISNIFPTHTDDNDAFDQRIQEEMMNNNLQISGRHTESLTLQNILDFIPKIDVYFENLLDTNNQNPDDFKLAELAVRDVEKAKKMLKPQDVTPADEHDLRIALNRINTKINAYDHTDAIEASSYIKNNN